MQTTFKEKYISPLIELLEQDLSYKIVEDFGLHARFYPDTGIFGNLNLHLEGGISWSGKEEDTADLLFVIYVRNKLVQTPYSRSVLCAYFDEEKQEWGNWKLYIDEFDEFIEPEKNTQQTTVPTKKTTDSSMEATLSHLFQTEFSILDENAEKTVYVTSLFTAFNLKMYVEHLKAADSINIRMELLDREARLPSTVKKELISIIQA